jgi:monoamine oxidase
LKNGAGLRISNVAGFTIEVFLGKELFFGMISTARRSANPAPADVLDVAIVGGGVSGVYSAWRLAETIRGNKISLFEGSDRIGGRLLSLIPPGAPHLRAEMGGMTYFSNQPLVRSLVENKLALPHEAVPPGASSLQPSPNNLIYLRGVHLSFEDLSNPSAIPYRLETAEQSHSQPPLAIVAMALQKLFPNLSSLSGDALQQGLRQTTYDDLPLWRWGFWNIISRGLSQEAYSYVRDAVGYDSLLMNFNAADVMGQFLDIGGNPTMNKVTGGYQQLPLTLCSGFHDAGGRVYMRHRLTKIELATTGADKLIELQFAANNTGWGPTATGDPVTFYAKKLILALPRRALELLDQSGQIFGGNNAGQFLRTLIGSVTPVPMFKAYLCYRGPWWEKLGLVAGKAVTDLPLRQCFYWGIEGDRPGADTMNRNSVLMAAFNDSTDEPYWGALSKLKAIPRNMHTFGPNDRSFLDPTSWGAYRASLSSPLVAELQRQLATIHTVNTEAVPVSEFRIPDPYDAACVDWSAEPFGGAYHAWNTGLKSWKMRNLIANPLESIPIFICGEAYSESQGYAEGALESAEFVLKSFFNLDPPGWITKSAAQ